MALLAWKLDSRGVVDDVVDHRGIGHYKKYVNTRRYIFVATSSRVLIYDDLTTKNQSSKRWRQKLIEATF